MKKLLIIPIVILIVACSDDNQNTASPSNKTESDTPEINNQISSIPEQQPPSKSTEAEPKKDQIDSILTPEQVVQDFYKAVSENDCIKAIQIRSDYKTARCHKTNQVVINQIQMLGYFEDFAVIYLDINYKQLQLQKSFKGYLKLKKQDNKWIIVPNSYASEQKYSLKEYLKWQHIPSLKDEMKKDASVKTEKQELNIHESINLGNYTFGSQVILNSCWTPKELQGSPRDKKVKRPIKNPFRGSPAIRTPYNPNPPLDPKLRNSIRYVIPDKNKKIIALSFDLCERTKEKTGYDAAIVNYLRKHRVKATFYAGGKWMHSHPEKATQLMADPLFEIGNHAWTHGNMRVLKGREMEDQVLWTQGQYEVLRNQLQIRLETKECSAPVTYINKIPKIPLTFRFPYGTCNAQSLKFLAKSGLPAVQWNIVTADPWSKQTANGIANTILRQAKPGSIIIAHANGRGHKTSKSLHLFIPKLRKRGYKFVTVTELLNSGKAITTKTCYEVKPGDNKRYDRIFGKGTE
jgi:peptidoglycan/xylan/chitin deacetylase (PgdA/CDA1 family)